MNGVGHGHAAVELQVVRAPRHMPITLTSPVQDHLRRYALINSRSRPMRVLHEGAYAGKTLALCGAGPSLDAALVTGTDCVFACNSAAPWLAERGVKLDAAITIDQTDVMLREWAVPPRCDYFLASTVDPRLVAHLRAFERPIRFFHSAVGFADEFTLYCQHYPPTIMAGTGYTVVGRLLGVARWLGFRRVDIHGADHAFGPDDVAHANGESAEAAYTTPMVMTGVIDGREWRTRADMLMAAVDLVRRIQGSPDFDVRLVGDTLPAALLHKDTRFLDQVCRVLEPGEDITN